ncbi:MAG: TfoX/Sxy family protein [Iamia sp.]
MAYDEDVAERIRELITETHDVTERKMFGGLAFLIGGNMALADSGEGGIMVRVGPEAYEHLLESTAAEEVVMRGRPMTGWVRVAADDVRTKRQLRPWVTRGADHAASLPPKAPKR